MMKLSEIRPTLDRAESALTFEEHLREVGNFNENEPRDVSHELIRGGRPLNRVAIDQLRGKGVRTVICLLRPDRRYPAEISNVEDERKAVQAAGIKFVAISMDERRDPREADVSRFLATVKSGSKSYAHCSAGRDRVGLMGAVYGVRVLGLSYEDVYARYLEGGHDYSTWPHLDRFLYRHTNGTTSAARRAIDRAVSPGDRDRLLRYITA